MSNDMKIVKFETLIKDVNEAIKGYDMMSWMRGRGRSTSLLLIYDYDQLNDYGKVIIEQSSSDLTSWNNKYPSFDSLKESKTKIDAAKELVNDCRTEENKKEAYKFIFWSMMVLTVDKTDKEEKLSLICDFSRMLKISDEEIMDILQVIKVIYHEEEEGFAFKSNTVPSYFSKVLNLYN